LRIFATLRKLATADTLKLVMVGKPWTAEMRRFVADNNLAEMTLELSAVSDEDLRALYSTATLLLFPSLKEGFGWPIVEAQACGCPVATSKRSPMDEVAGDAAIYLDPENPASAAAALKDALTNLASIREASLRNAARFRSGMIDEYVALYERVRKDKQGQQNIN
jgi:glycosyltransferase involved in cell wall biosynthesis